MSKSPKHLYKIDERVRVTEPGLPFPVGHEFTVTGIKHIRSDGGWGPWCYMGGGIPAGGSRNDPGVWERFLSTCEKAATDD